ncbi:MAG: hypothetical protein U0132_00945 [Gemmatimonadaceae bacterium]
MKDMRGLTVSAFILLAALGLTACVDAPSSPSAAADDNVLAASLDALSREAAQAGDTERSQEFTWAAIAVRGGVTPSKLQIKSAGVLQTYEAMVNAVAWMSPFPPQRVPSHRTLLAWRRAGTSLQTLMISSTADVVPVLNPLSDSPSASLAAPFAGAHVLYAIRGDIGAGTWVGVSGTVKLAENTATTTCVPVTGNKQSPNGVGCQQVTYTVGFEVATQPTVANSTLPATDRAVLHLGANDQPVNGAKLVLSCTTPNANGC